MFKVNYVQALVVASFWWGHLGCGGDECEEDAYRAEFDRAMSVFSWKSGELVSAEMISAIDEIRKDPGYARRCLAEVAGRKYTQPVHVQAFGVGWRDVPGVTVFVSGRAERAYRRENG